MDNQTRDFAERIKYASDMADVQEIFETEIRRFGYSKFIYAIVPTNMSDGLTDYITLHTVEPKWMQQYIDRKHFQHDVLVRHCTSGTENPYLFSTLSKQLDEGKLDRASSKVVRDGFDWGYHVGLTMPIRQANSFYAGSSFFAEKGVSAKEHDCFAAANEVHLRNILDVFHVRLDRSTLAKTHFNLTKRQIEVLKWLADGKSQTEISARLGLSRRAIENHVNRARTNLKSSTTIQAVAKAVALDIL